MRLQLRIVLEPFRHFQARHFGQLNIHQHQIGPVLAGEVERLDAVAGADGLVAMASSRSWKSFMLSSLSSTIRTVLAISPAPSAPTSSRDPQRRQTRRVAGAP